jgi:copper chaperone CopZ
MSQLLTVDGMACEHCAEAVESALSAVDGVTDARADHDAGTARVDGDAAVDELVAAVADAGYEAEATSSREAPTP